MKVQNKLNSISTGRWTAYAAAAAASGFGSTTTVDAEIHYSGHLDQRIQANGTASFPLGSGGAHFVAGHSNFVNGSSSFSAGGGAFLIFYGAQSAALNGTVGCFEDDVCASNLERRDAISTRPFVQGQGILAYDRYIDFKSFPSFGNFRSRGYGLVGFKFNNGAGDQYGWVRVRMMGLPRNYFGVVDYAYGDPGDKVLAGEKGSQGSEPMQESLGALALGAAGLLSWRRWRQP